MFIAAIETYHDRLDATAQLSRVSWKRKSGWEIQPPQKVHFLAFRVDLEITLLQVIPTMTFQNSQVRFYVSLIASGEGRHTTHLLKCVLLLSTSQTDWKLSSDVLSDISFDILSNISFDILSDLSSDILSDISLDILSDISSDILF